MKTSELTGAALDWAVMEAMKPQLRTPERCGIGTFGPLFGKGYKYPSWGMKKYAPSTDWKEGGPIIEREIVELVRGQSGSNGPVYWEARAGFEDKPGHAIAYGPTPLIAAMRCFVASKLGDEVDVPKELT
jgi:Protein of unknown function (DUF2591)